MDVTVISSVINDGVVLVGVLGGVFGLSKSGAFQKAVGFIEKEAPVIAQGIEDVAHLPGAKVAEAKAKTELDTLTSHLKNSALLQYSQAVISGAQRLYDELSPAEQAAAIKFVKDHLPPSISATEKEIVSALKSAPDLAKKFAGDATFAKAQELTDLLTKAAAPEPAPVATAADTSTQTPAASEATSNGTDS